VPVWGKSNDGMQANILRLNKIRLNCWNGGHAIW
jgi:hypothetical protein